MKYPILYKSNETDFFTMGLGPIEMLKATVTQERNGIFIFEGEILTDNPLFPLVLENYIIKADADHLLKDQRFRIKRIVPNHSGKAEIYAEHVSYLSRELTIKPEVNITGSAQVALNQWKASIVEANPFIVSSDITTSASAKWRIDKVSNPMMALGGVEGSILDRWGGEYLFDNYHISLLKKRGKTATNILAYGRNITDFEQERNILSTYTSVAPYAIYTDDREREFIITVDGYVVDSEHINKYPNRVTKPIDFSSEFGSEEIPTKARLTTLAQQYIADNEIGVPTTSIKISFLDLSQTADYADYAFLEQVNLCDDVRVHYPKLGVNTIAKVVRVVWNCLTESYDEIEIGQKRMSLASQIQEQQKAIQEINTQTNYAMTSADGKNTIFYGLYGENGLGEPKAIKVGDTWYKPNGTGTDMLVWTGTIWQVVLNAETFNQINEKIDQAEKDIAQNILDIDAALDKATQAELDAGFSKDLAEEAKSLGVTASSLASEATTNANKAMTDAQEAIRQVEINEGVVADASADATEAKRLAGLAEGNSQEALTKANASVTDASTAMADAQEALDAYNNMEIGGRNLLRNSNFSDGFNFWVEHGVSGSVSDNIYTVSLSGIGLSRFYYNTIDISEVGPTVTVSLDVRASSNASIQIGQNDYLGTPFDVDTNWKRISRTFNPSTINTLTVRLNTSEVDYEITNIKLEKGNKATDWTPAPEDVQTQITNINGELSQKVSQTTFDTLQGTVTSQGTQINQNKTDITLKANQSSVNTLTGRVTTAEGSITAQAGQIALKANTTTVSALTGRVSAAESALTVQSGKIDLAATKTELTTAIDGLEIGGRNYFSVKAWENRQPFYVNGISALKIKLEPNTEYIMSTNIPNWADNTTCDLFVFNSDAIPQSGANGVALNKPRKVTTLSDGFVIVAMRNREFSSGAFWAMLSKGNKALDWSPAPEDVESAISTVQANLTVEAGKIASKVSQTDFDALNGRVGTAESTITQNTTAINLRATKTDVNALTGRVSTAEGNITTQAGQIALKANQSTVDTLTGRVSTTEAKITATDGKVTTLTTKTDGNTTSIGKLQTSYTGLSSTVATVKQDLDGLEIGGRNYVLNSEVGADRLADASWSDAYMYLSDGMRGLSGEFEIGFDVMLDSEIVGVRNIDFTLQVKGGGLAAFTIFPYKVISLSPGVTTHLSRTFTGDFTAFTSDGGRIAVKFGGAPDALVHVKKLYIKKGNKTTDWSPAPEDMATVTAFSALEQNLSGFKTTVQNTYADKTTVTQLAGQWTTTTNLVNGHTSQIASLGTDINLRATKAELISQINTSPESILIASSKIQIKGDTYIESGVIKNAHIADLAVDGAKIANASIASAKIISLDASKITVGTLTGHTINSAVINGGSITGTTFHNEGTDGNVTIANGRIRAKDFFVRENGALVSETGYIVIRSMLSDVYLQSNSEVRVTSVRSYNEFMPVRASSFIAMSNFYSHGIYEGANDAVFQSNASNVSLRAVSGDVYLRGRSILVTNSAASGYTNIYANAFIGRGGNTTFGADEGYTVVRSSGDTQPVYLQGNEIRATSVSHAGYYVPVRASAFPTGSMESFKANIHKRHSSALELIRQSDIYEYNLKSDLRTGKVKTRIGLVIGSGYNTPAEIIDGDGVEQYAMNSLAWQAIQELDQQVMQNKNSNDFEIFKLKAEIQELKHEIQALRQSA